MLPPGVPWAGGVPAALRHRGSGGGCGGCRNRHACCGPTGREHEGICGGKSGDGSRRDWHIVDGGSGHRRRCAANRGCRGRCLGGVSEEGDACRGSFPTEERGWGGEGVSGVGACGGCPQQPDSTAAPAGCSWTRKTAPRTGVDSGTRASRLVPLPPPQRQDSASSRGGRRLLRASAHRLWTLPLLFIARHQLCRGRKGPPNSRATRCHVSDGVAQTRRLALPTTSPAFPIPWYPLPPKLSVVFQCAVGRWHAACPFGASRRRVGLRPHALAVHVGLLIPHDQPPC